MKRTQKKNDEKKLIKLSNKRFMCNLLFFFLFLNIFSPTFRVDVEEQIRKYGRLKAFEQIYSFSCLSNVVFLRLIYIDEYHVMECLMFCEDSAAIPRC